MHDVYPGSSWQKLHPVEAGVSEAAVKHAIGELPKNNTLIGMMIVKEGYCVLEHYNPRYDNNTISQVFSVTKSMLSALLGIAIDKKLVGSLNEPIYHYFPEMEPPVNAYLKKTVTLKHLLTMTAGLYVSKRHSFGARIETTEDWIKNTLELPISLKVANCFHYNDLYPHLFSAVITKQAQMSTIEFANRFLFKKIGIEPAIPFSSFDAMFEIVNNKVRYGEKQQHSRWLCDPKGHACGGFGLMMSLCDMARFGYLFLKGGNWNGEQVLPAGWVEESTRAYTDTGNRDVLTAIFDEKEEGAIKKQGINTAYGYYWWVFEGDISYYAALGYGGQRIIVIPSRNMVIAIKTTYSGLSAYQHVESLWKKIALESKE